MTTAVWDGQNHRAEPASVVAAAGLGWMGPAS